MLIIILSSVALAAEDPINDESDWNNYLDVVDNVFTVIFAIEMILKVSAVGFVRHTTDRTLTLLVCIVADNRSGGDFTSRVVSQGVLEHHGRGGSRLRVRVIHIPKRVMHHRINISYG